MDDIRNWKRQRLMRYAHHLVYIACLSGELNEPDCCELCGKEELLVAHHDDYRKPLLVRWLCPSCHKQHHVDLQRSYRNRRMAIWRG